MWSIEVKNLIKRYNKATQNAVDDISFNVSEGEFFALLGPNGAGKTTTISILTTTLAKTSGLVTIAGFDLDKNPSDVRQRIGVIFQNHSLDMNLTAEENIRLHAALYGLYPFSPSFGFMPKEYKEKVDNLAKILGLQKEIFKPIKTFSGGMKRKLEIIRSLIHNPKVLFLDEPTSGLDPVSRKSLWNYLSDVRKNENTTIFLTTHYLEEAEQADHICVINQGKIVSLGTPNEIKRNLIEDYLEIDAENPRTLKEELEKLRIAFSEENPFKIHLNGSSIHEIIKSIETPLTSIKIHNPTLVEAYLEIIERGNNREQPSNEK
jgi:ABC-2 type transport system ATP-binding protein